PAREVAKRHQQDPKQLARGFPHVTLTRGQGQHVPMTPQMKPEALLAKHVRGLQDLPPVRSSGSRPLHEVSKCCPALPIVYGCQVRHLRLRMRRAPFKTIRPTTVPMTRSG